MGWIHKLHETYENCFKDNVHMNSEIQLIPICHTTQKAQIEIVIDEKGYFKRARIVPKEYGKTVIPCTEASGGRAGKKPINHPLCDKLQYLAKDFDLHGGEVTVGYLNNPNEPYESFINLLKSWCDSEFAHPKAKAILEYVERGSIITDLVNHGIMFLDSNNKFITKWNEDIGETPEIFKVSNNSRQDDVFIRWLVEEDEIPQSAVWTDKSLQESWINYYSKYKKNKALCYVTGKVLPYADQHPAKIRNEGDKAKIISSNDTSGFTFLGRFTNSDQACGVGFEITQKAHNALKWLIEKQGYKRGDQVFVAWSTVGKNIPDPLTDTLGLFGFDDSNITIISTAQEFAKKLNSKIAGYSAELRNTASIVMIGLDSATPGRLSITFYRELTGSDFLMRLEQWHQTCCWVHNYIQKEVQDEKTGKNKKINIKFTGAPAPKDIIEAIYGLKVDDKLRKAAMERIVPCIIDGQKIPRDFIDVIIKRASNRLSMEEWEWNKTLSIACSLIRKFKLDYEEEVFDMSLDTNRKSRDYLFGRLLALADSLEQWALKESGENRQTNAARMMQRFAERPFSTWRTIELALTPYKARLGPASSKRQNIISEVMALFEPDDFTSDRKLSGEFLLGYHCQRDALWSETK